MPAKLNLVNQKYGRLVVLRESLIKINNQPTWDCLCECGKEIQATTKQLRSGTKKSCGCIKRKNIIGQRYGKLTVIDYTNENRHGSALWKCQCDCGNITYATTEGLRVGDNVSCGCRNLGSELFKNKYKVNLSGQIFGKLTVLSATDMRTNAGNQIWKCQCECGNVVYISTNHLQTGNTKSCGCLHGHSTGELKIKQLLDSHNIEYKSEYIFEDLPNRRYDFAIFKDNQIVRLIEFDGEQHYIEAPFFKTTLKEQQDIDKEKTNFAISKNIPLTRIPYWKRETLIFEDLEVFSDELSQ